MRGVESTVISVFPFWMLCTELGLQRGFRFIMRAKQHQPFPEISDIGISMGHIQLAQRRHGLAMQQGRDDPVAKDALGTSSRSVEVGGAPGGRSHDSRLMGCHQILGHLRAHSPLACGGVEGKRFGDGTGDRAVQIEILGHDELRMGRTFENGGVHGRQKRSPVGIGRVALVQSAGSCLRLPWLHASPSFSERCGGLMWQDERFAAPGQPTGVGNMLRCFPWLKPSRRPSLLLVYPVRCVRIRTFVGRTGSPAMPRPDHRNCVSL